MRFLAIALALILLAPTQSLAAQGSSDLLKIDDSAQDATFFIQQGIGSYDEGDFDAAIRAFQKALDLEPNNTYAVYELALTYAAMHEPQIAFDTIKSGLERGIDEIPELYMLAASSLDDLGRSDEAIDMFIAAIDRFPGDFGIRLNLAISYMRLNRVAEARALLEESVSLEPSHPSGHRILGTIYGESQEIIPAVLALSYSAALDRDEDRRRVVVNRIRDLLEGGTTLVNDEGALVLSWNADETVPFSALGNMLPLLTVGAIEVHSDDGENLTYLPYADMLALVIAMIDEEAEEPPPHFANNYLPYFREMDAAGHGETFAHLILSPLDMQAARAWLDENTEAVESFSDWVGQTGLMWPDGNRDQEGI
ncbi:MAG: tetratricopeptide repeat protein [Woeseiaceae bacterium]|nr:tetratricopeptide repeat protein [Woeseiaceae bacterium]